jgi:hypothetical protein
LIRNLLRLVDFLPFGYLVGGAVLFASPRGQRLGDVAAGTLVVRVGPLWMEEALAPRSSPVTRPEHSGLPVALLRAARTLAARRLLPARVMSRRRAQVLAAARRCRPDLATLSDDELWRFLSESSS